MQNAIVHLHNLFRWVILVMLIFSIVRSYSGWKSKKAFAPEDAKIWLFTLISAHTTLLLGLYLVFFGRYGIISAGLPQGVELMKDKFYRFLWIEHPFAMILSIVLITVGRGMAKRNIADALKYRNAFWFFLIALIIILATIPWAFRETVGRPWI
ncbi:MAG: hypothetical protein ACHQET_05505 [Chitinophagales bacterium]